VLKVHSLFIPVASKGEPKPPSGTYQYDGSRGWKAGDPKLIGDRTNETLK
jgi:hypothetical protein